MKTSLDCIDEYLTTIEAQNKLLEEIFEAAADILPEFNDNVADRGRPSFEKCARIRDLISHYRAYKGE